METMAKIFLDQYAGHIKKQAERIESELDAYLNSGMRLRKDTILFNGQPVEVQIKVYPPCGAAGLKRRPFVPKNKKGAVRPRRKRR